MALKECKAFAMDRFNLTDALKNRLGFKDLQTGNSRRTSERISAIRVAVKEGARPILAVEGLVNFFCADRGCKRHEAAGQPLGQAHDVRNYRGMLAGKHAACSPEAGEHFIRYKQHIVSGTKFAITLECLDRVHDHAARTLNEGFDDHGRNVVAVLFKGSL